MMMKMIKRVQENNVAKCRKIGNLNKLQTLQNFKHSALTN